MKSKSSIGSIRMARLEEDHPRAKSVIMSVEIQLQHSLEVKTVAPREESERAEA